jgi:hypothetical protein
MIFLAKTVLMEEVSKVKTVLHWPFLDSEAVEPLQQQMANMVQPQALEQVSLSDSMKAEMRGQVVLV